jgi:hypothetical protein
MSNPRSATGRPWVAVQLDRTPPTNMRATLPRPEGFRVPTEEEREVLRRAFEGGAFDGVEDEADRVGTALLGREVRDLASPRVWWSVRA